MEGLDDEDQQTLEEVRKKGYYHGRPLNGDCERPKLISSEPQAVGLQNSTAASRRDVDEFQKKWDRFDRDDFLETCVDEAGTPNKLLKQAQAQKEKGLQSYKADDYSNAVEHWTKTRELTQELLKDNLFANAPGQKDETLKLEINIDLNLAQAYLKMQQPSEALAYCENVLEREPQNEKALYRKASAQLILDDLGEGRNTLKALLNAVPEHAGARQMLLDIARKQKERKYADKAIAKKMFETRSSDSRLADSAGQRSKTMRRFIHCCRRSKTD